MRYSNMFTWMALASLCQSYLASSAETCQVPAKGTKSLVRDESTIRNPDGTVTISGVLLLPPGTKLKLTRLSPSGAHLGQCKVALSSTGTFAREQFSDMGIAPASGPQKVQILAMFNRAWQQPPSVVSIVGEDGRKLPASAVKLNDREFPNEGGHLDETKTVQFPPSGEDVVAIEHVKNAKLFSLGNGQAVDKVDFIAQTPSCDWRVC